MVLMSCTTLLLIIALLVGGGLFIGGFAAASDLQMWWMVEEFTGWARPSLMDAPVLGVTLGLLALALFAGALWQERRPWSAVSRKAKRSWGRMMLFIVAAFVVAPWGAELIQIVPLLDRPQFLFAHPVAAVSAFVAAFGIIAAGAVIWRLKPTSGGGRIAQRIMTAVSLGLGAVLGVLVVTWSASFYFDMTLYVSDADNFEGDVGSAMGVLIIIVAPVLLVLAALWNLPGWLLPHRPYVWLLSREFAIARTPSGGAARIRRSSRIAMSSLVPGTDTAFPELVICAAGNTEPKQPSAAGQTIPVRLSGSGGMELPTEGASISAAALEQFLSPTGYSIQASGRIPFGAAPTLNLMSAVGIAGAAVSPTMGRHTIAAVRPLLAVFNVRLGLWVPNPLADGVGEQVESGGGDRLKVSGGQLVWEALGLHVRDTPMLYVSDGGHYENLGLVELLRRRCAEIWAIDASADKPGRADAFEAAAELASEELKCEIDIDLSRFAVDDEGRAQHVHAHGTVTYDDGEKAALHLVKLGVTREHSDEAKPYASGHRSFPLHSTLRQIYPRHRFEAYQALGRENVGIAASDR